MVSISCEITKNVILDIQKCTLHIKQEEQKKKKYWPKGQREKNDPPPVASFKMKEVRQGINKGKTIRKSLIVYLRSWFLKNKPCLNAINGRYVQSIVTIQTFSFFF